MIDKIIELFEKGYCNECNELNCLGGEPSSKVVANAIRELQQENKQLKEQLKQRNEVIAEAMRYIKKIRNIMIENILKFMENYAIWLEQEIQDFMS